MMDKEEEIPLHSAKGLVRRLKNANNRLSRNTDVFSLHFESTKDLQTANNHGDPDYFQLDEFDEMTMQDQDEETSASSNASEHCMDHECDASIYGVLSDDDDDNNNNNNDDDDNDNEEINSFQTSDDAANNEVQSGLPNSREISIALSLFRRRHNLSKSCVNDLCELLRYLGVKNVPTDFRTIQRNILKNQENILQGKKYSVCSKCGNKGNIKSKCENTKCTSSVNHQSISTELCTFKLLPQITSILERHVVLPQPDNDCSRISDVQEGAVWRNIFSQQLVADPKRQIVTFLLNSDGIVLKKSSRSIWVSCMIINELPRAIRFNINNVIICSISIGSNKPKKTEFQSHISDWVRELRQLELGFYVSPPNSNRIFLKTHTYLIAATLDKPAQALLMNMNDPVGFYSCVRCTIKGKSVQSGNGSIRVFIRNTEDNIEDRKNALYDKHLLILSQRRSKLKTNEYDPACGRQGVCLLRDLSYFNIGQSCTADSLHNVYAGTFKRLLELWFKSRRQPFSIHKSLHIIEAQLDSIRYSSTTYHVPSQLRHFQAYKGNEYRLVLLFGYQ
ncbi:unnamed protein product [Rotaria socialis]|uniref:Uncharacterized protein n=1 Tax=Rotaria socialis TaxID=392032 RepID=A0A820UND9_9BILA|nr:unnamed protein product [Rotaria socialis]CAF3163902.1 unnamed protein product [Rotaria socialis]CAF3417089.1 unnamed protein product [Rotaria socialis]CAF4251371.1 unnamed protein product [Rotaria socialis]CAF4487875.1 unnamed protein product [Rotaria socialis]